MEKGEYIPILWMSAAYAVMIAAKAYLVEPLASYVGFSGILVFMGGTVAQDYYARLTIAEYMHLVATVRPSWIRAEFFFISFNTKDLGDGRFLTTMYLGVKYPHPVYGKVDIIYVLHTLPWKARVKLRHGKASFLGMTVPHPFTDYVVFHEKEPYVDHAQRYPVYEMVLAGGDFPHIEDIIREGYKTHPELAVQMSKEAGEE